MLMSKREIMLSWLRVLLITLLITTVLWVGLLYESLQDHFGYNELLKVISQETGEYPFHLSRTWIGRNSVKLLIVIGGVLIFSWILAAREKWRERIAEKVRV